MSAEKNVSKRKIDRRFYCRRCDLTIEVPVEGRNEYRLGSCPSCDFIAWSKVGTAKSTA